MTGDSVTLLDQANLLAAMLQRFQDFRSRDDLGRAKALVALRREFSAQVTALAGAVRPILRLEVRQSQQDEFRRLHSALLSSLALHQATWPAVRLTEMINDTNYARSARTVDEAGYALVTWLRTCGNEKRRTEREP